MFKRIEVEERKDRMVEVVDDFNLEKNSSQLSVKSHIADGSYGSVYKGVYGGKLVAIKVIRIEEKQDSGEWSLFVQEVSIWQGLDHPNVAHLIDATKGISDLSKILKNHGNGKLSKILKNHGNGKDSRPRTGGLMVVEYLGGGTLSSYLNKMRKLPLHTVIKLALDVAKGLAYLHSKKIIHRDVKTDNVLLDKEKKSVKIVDFGVSTFEGLDMEGNTGTDGYMAPEVRSCNPYDHKCDVFSYGICLVEIFSCKPPKFRMSCRPEIPKSCPENLATLMKHCWEAEPRRRPEMAEVVKVLEDMAMTKREEGTTKIHCLGF